MQAIVAATGIIGTFRGPRDAGTGYVKLYHSMGMATGQRGALGVRPRRDGRRSPRRSGGWRASAGVTIRTTPRSPQINVRKAAGRPASCSSPARRSRAKVVLSNADPKRTYLKLVAGRRVAGRLPAGDRGDQDREPGDEDQHGRDASCRGSPPSKATISVRAAPAGSSSPHRSTTCSEPATRPARATRRANRS